MNWLSGSEVNGLKTILVPADWNFRDAGYCGTYSLFCLSVNCFIPRDIPLLHSSMLGRLSEFMNDVTTRSLYTISPLSPHEKCSILATEF
jgi:hypothetical protein